jgi:hypothetical protein
VPRLSRSEQISLTGTVGGGIGNLGGSIATGDSTGEVDFLDLNGDLFPDVVGAGGIQYTDPSGALGDTRGTLPDGAVRRTSNQTGNASAGSAARTISTGRGHTTPPGHSTANTAEAGNDLPPLGVGGSLGGSRADTGFDLLDLNGDGLPDRVYSDGQVALNLGYRFGAKEAWGNAGAVNDGSGSNFGLNIGFNTGFYGFAGGASYSEGSHSANSTLADLNGDGLMDRVFAGDPITVSLNTGNGFQPPVPFHGSLAGINEDQQASLGGGAYVTFSICFIVVCIIINPGGNVSTGASRTEQMLRDLNGDGYPEHLLSTSDDQLTVAQNLTNRTNLLASVTRPLGARMDFDYTRDGNTVDQPQSRWCCPGSRSTTASPATGRTCSSPRTSTRTGCTTGWSASSTGTAPWSSGCATPVPATRSTAASPARTATTATTPAGCSAASWSPTRPGTRSPRSSTATCCGTWTRRRLWRTRRAPPRPSSRSWSAPTGGSTRARRRPARPRSPPWSTTRSAT